MTTEAEAKETACHRTLAAVGVTADGPVHAVRPCQGSACAAWRWDTAGWSMQVDEKGPYLLRGGSEYPQGYCGLAGKP